MMAALAWLSPLPVALEGFKFKFQVPPGAATGSATQRLPLAVAVGRPLARLASVKLCNHRRADSTTSCAEFRVVLRLGGCRRFSLADSESLGPQRPQPRLVRPVIYNFTSCQ